MITATDNGSIKPPKNIITTTQAARSLYEIYRRDHLKRILLYSQIEGLIAGNPPYDPVELQKNGLSHIANFNSLDGRALYERAALAYWSLLHNAECIINISFNLPGTPDATRFSRIMSDRWWQVVNEDWPSFRTAVNTLIAQIVKFGISPVFWYDELDWKWRTIEVQRFFLPPQTSTDTELITNLCIESMYTAQYLMEVYETYKDDPNSPWDCDALAKLLLFYANSYVKPDKQYQDMMELQQQLQSGGQVFEAFFSDSFKLISLYYREYDGKISHYMFDRYFDNGSFLYFVDRQYNSFEEALIIFTASPGEFLIHSNRGVGHKIFSACQAMMQIDCATVDMAKITSTPFLKTLQGTSKDMEQIRVYPGTPTNIGTAEFVQTNFGANISQLIGTSQFLLNKINFNAANAGDDPSFADRNQGSISPTEARMRSFREFGVLKNNIQHFYSFFDRLLQNMVTKMLHSKKGYPNHETVSKWKSLCIADGVPEELFDLKGAKRHELPSHINVAATRVAGDGSTAALIAGLEALAPVAPNFSEKGAKEYQRQWVRAVMGPEYVDTFIESDNSEDEGEGASLAAVENSVMRMGESAVVSPSNVHQAHISTHAALLNEVIGAIKQQQMTPLDGDKIFAQVIPHVEEHLQIYSQSIFSKQFLAGFDPAWKEITRFARNNRVLAAKMAEAAVRKRQEEEAATESAMNEEQRKNMMLQAELARKEREAQAKIDRGKQQSEARAEIARAKVEKDAEIKRLAVELDAQVKSQKAQGDVQVKSQKNQLEQMSTNQLKNEVERLAGERPAEYDFE
jgi:hypothetical protein